MKHIKILLTIYLHHAALNFGVALSAIWWTIIPPFLYHTKEGIEELKRSSSWEWFKWGLGIGKEPK